MEWPHMGMGQNPIPLVNIKIAGKWMFIPQKMVLIGIDPYPYHHRSDFLTLEKTRRTATHTVQARQWPENVEETK